MKKLIFSLSLVLSFVSTLYAQNGIVRGRLIEGSTGKPAVSATLKLNGVSSSSNAVSDLEGAFTFSVPAGNYSLEISTLGFDKIVLTDIIVSNEKVTVVPDIILNFSEKNLKEVVITSKKYLRTSEEAITTLRRKSSVIIDGISSAKMKLTGDATAVEAAKRVTGVSIEGGRYVYVRGLGDRYSKTTLNGLDIPGLDPDRNSLQMDIFPTALIDNIIVSKNFLPNLSADFTGGLLNIVTNDFPTKKIINLSASMSYNPSMHFNENFLKGNQGRLDWLGMDDGSRALPNLARSTNNIPTPISGAGSDAVNNFVNSFNPTLGANKTRSFADYSFGFSIGDQFDFGKKNHSASSPKLGYVAALSYRVEQKFFGEAKYGEYQKNIIPNQNELVAANTLTGNLSEGNVLLGGLAGIAYKTKLSKIDLNIVRLQSGENRAGQFSILNNSDAVGQSGYNAFSDNIEFSQRSITNLQISGSHLSPDKSWKFDWAVGTTTSDATDPDIRKTAFTIDPGRTYFNPGAGGNPSRIWRYLDETNSSLKIDIDKQLGKKNTLRFGALGLLKERKYEIRFYNVQFFGSQQQNWPINANQVLIPSNIYPSVSNNIYYVSGVSEPNSNEYNSRVNNVAAYLMDEIDFSKNTKAIVGMRMEKYVQFHTGRDQRFASGDVVGGKNLVDAKVLDKLNFFPSVNLIQKFGPKINLRFSYAITTARPSFKELSFAQILDPLTNRIFNGSLFTYEDWSGNLRPTMIDNFDLRAEKYFRGAEVISISFFSKAFKDPIELVRIPQQQTSTEYQPRNVGQGFLVGTEIEINKSFDFISETLEKLNFNANITLVKSNITMTDVEYNARKAYEKAGENLKNTRPMAGQSPYIINAGLSYTDTEKGINLGMFYNVKGPTVYIVGSGLFPDVYAIPFKNLNLTINKAVNKSKNINITLRAENILNDDLRYVFRGYNATDKIFSSLNPGRSFSLGFSYKY